ncbi:MAG: hypothetical protein GQ578_10540 [Desulfuromonadaceae bacterium]|nr:hypothetical protein [Desulfuromonadaceae bacterium]
MTLVEAFSQHLVKGQQGQLVIKLAGDIHLCKILIENGEAVHISHGRLAPEQIIAALTAKTVEWINFIAGYPVRKKLDYPLHQQLLATFGNSALPPPAAAAPVSPTAVPEQVKPVSVGGGDEISADRVNLVIDGFIDLVGPIGTILAEQAATAMNYTLGKPIQKPFFDAFVLALAKEVLETDRSDFIERFTI